MINSRFPLVSATPTRSPPHGQITLRAPLLPKLRGHFAEFLNHDSLDRLSILYLITCVGFGYGQLKPHADAFLGSIGSPNPPKTGSHHVSGTQPAHLTTDNPTRLDHDNHRVAWLPSCVTPVNTFTSKDRVPQPTQHTNKSLHIMLRMVSITISVWAVFHRYGNINPLSIDYACRPRLRSRLTQGGRTCPWNPESSGGRDSHPSFATHACILTRIASTTESLRSFTGHTTLPYPKTPELSVTCFCHNFGGVLKPRYIIGAESLDQ